MEWTSLKTFDRSALPAELKHTSRIFVRRHDAYRKQRFASRTDAARAEARTDASTSGVCLFVIDERHFDAIVNASDSFREVVRTSAGLKPKHVKKQIRDEAWIELLAVLDALSPRR